jgi:hypothetical protein
MGRCGDETSCSLIKKQVQTIKTGGASVRSGLLEPNKIVLRELLSKNNPINRKV